MQSSNQGFGPVKGLGSQFVGIQFNQGHSSSVFLKSPYYTNATFEELVRFSQGHFREHSAPVSTSPSSFQDLICLGSSSGRCIQAAVQDGEFFIEFGVNDSGPFLVRRSIKGSFPTNWEFVTEEVPFKQASFHYIDIV